MLWNRKRGGEADPVPEAGATWNPATAEEGAVESIRAWVDSGSELAAIVDQAPSYDANPDTVHYLRQRSREAALSEIDAEHARRQAAIEAEDRHRRAAAERETRAVREAEDDADEAAADLRMDRAYERDFSPVVAARSLSASARRWRGFDLGYALVGSGLSAAGITATLHATTDLPMWGCAGLAVAAYTVMTVRVVDLIGRLARLQDQDRADAPQQGRQDDAAAIAPGRDATRTHLVRQAGALLALSVLANAAGALMGAGLLGVVGMAGAILAAMAGIGSHASSRAAAGVVAANMAAWRGANWQSTRKELRRRASGAYIPDLGAPDEFAPARKPATESTEAGEASPWTTGCDGADDDVYRAGVYRAAVTLMETDIEFREQVAADLGDITLRQSPVPDDATTLTDTEIEAEGGGTALADRPEDLPDSGAEPHVNPAGDHADTLGQLPAEGVHAEEGAHGGTAGVHAEPSTDDTPSEGELPEEGSHGGEALAERNRRAAEQARRRVRDYYRANPTAPIKKAARDLQVSPNTVRKYQS